MTKRTNARIPRDSGWINLEEPREVRYWTAALAVSEAGLRSAVRAAGDATSAVRQYLGGQHQDVESGAADTAGERFPRQMMPSTGRSSPSGSQQQG